MQYGPMLQGESCQCIRAFKIELPANIRAMILYGAIVDGEFITNLFAGLTIRYQTKDFLFGSREFS